MEIILTQDYPSLGYVGDRVAVARGYARNYLIPRGMAVEVGSLSAKKLQHRLAGINAHKARLKKEAEAKAAELRQAKLEFVLKIGEHGKSFGSVTARDLELKLIEQGFSLDRKQIRLHDSIKSGGTFEVEIKLHSEVTVELPVHVTVERIQPKPTGDEEKPRARRGRGKTSRSESSEESSRDLSTEAASEEMSASSEETSAE
ncbi:MAG: 50S ribosomal protein L9 [Bdellovibrionales bacterium]|nr:50S ribosomal protein L9 [Bdellovibrionales bacterium]